VELAIVGIDDDPDHFGQANRSRKNVPLSLYPEQTYNAANNGTLAASRVVTRFVPGQFVDALAHLRMIAQT